MRFRVDVDLGGRALTLPLNYQELIQGILYHAMPKDLAEEGHLQIAGVRKMSLFTFSRLFGKSNIDISRKLICFRSLYFYVSTCNERLGCTIMANLSDSIRFYEESFPCQLSMVETYRNGNWIEMLSPVTAHKTDIDSKRITYLEPNSIVFAQAIYQNLQRKYRYFYREDYDGPFALSALPKSLKSSNILYKKTYIKGYMGKFHLIASPKAMQLLYDVGLGEKNAQGFGMFRMEENKDV